MSVVLIKFWNGWIWKVWVVITVDGSACCLSEGQSSLYHVCLVSFIEMLIHFSYTISLCYEVLWSPYRLTLLDSRIRLNICSLLLIVIDDLNRSLPVRICKKEMRRPFTTNVLSPFSSSKYTVERVEVCGYSTLEIQEKLSLQTSTRAQNIYRMNVTPWGQKPDETKSVCNINQIRSCCEYLYQSGNDISVILISFKWIDYIREIIQLIQNLFK